MDKLYKMMLEYMYRIWGMKDIWLTILESDRENTSKVSRKSCAINRSFFALQDLQRYIQRLKYKTIMLQFCR
jgi:hypothetical protein